MLNPPEPRNANNPPPLYAIDERQQRREFDLLLDSWLQAHQARATAPGESVRFDVPIIVADARAALERGLTPYMALLLVVARQFVNPGDRELEVLDVEDEAADGC